MVTNLKTQKETMVKKLESITGDREVVVEKLMDDCYNRIEGSNDYMYIQSQLDYIKVLLETYFELK